MDIYEEITRLRREGRRGALATIINVRGSIPSFESAKMLVRDDGTIVGTIGGGCVEAEVWEAARESMKTEKPQTLHFDLNNNPKYDTGLVCGGTLEVLSNLCWPSLRSIFSAQDTWPGAYIRSPALLDSTLSSPTTARAMPTASDSLMPANLCRRIRARHGATCSE